MLRNAVLVILCLLLGAACSSPTSFVTERDVTLTVDDAVATTSPNGSVQVTLRYVIANHGNRTLGSIGFCSGARLTPVGGAPIDLGLPCISIPASEIPPGGSLENSVAVGKTGAAWGPTVTGDHVLRLAVFVEGRPRAEEVSSAPFLIQFPND